MKIWQCYDGLAAQQWYYTNDQRIALEGNSTYQRNSMRSRLLTTPMLAQCLDLTNGNAADGTQRQT